MGSQSGVVGAQWRELVIWNSERTCGSEMKGKVEALRSYQGFDFGCVNGREEAVKWEISEVSL